MFYFVNIIKQNILRIYFRYSNLLFLIFFILFRIAKLVSDKAFCSVTVDASQNFTQEIDDWENPPTIGSISGVVTSVSVILQFF